MICELLGVDGSQWPRFFDWSEAVIPGESERSEEERAALQVEMWEYLIGVAEERRRAPADDLVSVLATVGSDPESGGEELSEAELAMFLIQLLVAGNETTRNLISGGLVALAENPAQWAALRADRSLLPSAVEELLRWTTPVISFMRTATAHTTIRGVAVAAGDPVLLVYASANRDEEVFGPDAGELRVDRHPNPHVSFGFGPHFCLGAALGPAGGQGRPRPTAGPLRDPLAGRDRSNGRRARSSPASGTPSWSSRNAALGRRATLESLCPQTGSVWTPRDRLLRLLRP